ncbi:MAG: type II toxin-antitoxin system Phd/YefM family antitoxin [Firmicutes bacterium]|nr:type II toxin-antitoxin system Phd/YefM family antitoxin [Bacillota bacterium]
MLIDTKKMIPISEANRNFSKVAKMVDEDKSIIIMRNNKPKYVIIDFDEFNKENDTEEQLDIIADRILHENIKALKNKGV